jgi:hypothetical protein
VMDGARSDFFDLSAVSARVGEERLLSRILFGSVALEVASIDLSGAAQVASRGACDIAAAPAELPLGKSGPY